MIGIVGAGAFGTALAIALAEAGNQVTLWTRSSDHAEQMRRDRENAARLPGCPFPASLTPTHSREFFHTSDVILAAIPLQSLRRGLAGFAMPDAPIVACCKGFELSTGLGPTGVIREIFPASLAAILTGPSFAADIAIGRPTALTLACAEADLGARLQDALTTPTLRLYRTTDTIGAELGGALKNVIAIACGVVIGAGLGDSARAATMTRGFAEMRRIGVALGADPETLTGLSGLGDLALTCTSDLSRNYRHGLSLGAGTASDPSITVEGVATARAMAEMAQKKNLDLPLTKTVTALLDGAITVQDAIADLMTRPLKEE